MERKEKIKGWLITEKEARVAEFVPTLENYYKMLDCDLIDIAVRRIGEHFYDIIVDDEGLLKDNPRITAVNSNNEPMLAGNLLIVKHDDEGNEIGLTDEEIEECKSSTGKLRAITPDGKSSIYWAILCEY